MLGGVVLTQGQNVLRGDRLMVDMTTGVSRVESDSGRVQGLFQSSGRAAANPDRPGTPGAGPPQSPGARSKTKIIFNRLAMIRAVRLNRGASLYLRDGSERGLSAKYGGVSLGKGDPFIHAAVRIKSPWRDAQSP